jgi:hypothetical protein
MNACVVHLDLNEAHSLRNRWWRKLRCHNFYASMVLEKLSAA